MDGQGRLLLPEKLRTFANVDKKIVLSVSSINLNSGMKKLGAKKVNGWMVMIMKDWKT
jgi:MraZ protein